MSALCSRVLVLAQGSVRFDRRPAELAAVAANRIWTAEGEAAEGAAVQRFPSYALFPFASGGPGWERAGITWSAIAVAATGIVIALSRDPATRHRRAGSGR